MRSAADSWSPDAHAGCCRLDRWSENSISCDARPREPCRMADGTPPTRAVALLPVTVVGRKLARLRARLHRSRLDVALASGVDPWSDAELLIRATQLSALRTRRGLAEALEKIVTIAESPRPEPATRCIRLRRHAVLQQRECLLTLAAHIQAPAPVPIAVLAQLRLLVGDPSSPIYRGGAPADDLATAVDNCVAGLDPSTGRLAL